MNKMLQKLCRNTAMHILMCLLFLICPMMAYSATIPLYVGETGGLEAPDAVSDNGYIDNAVVLESDKNLYVDTSNPIDVKVTVVGYFSYTATVKIRYVEKYTYNGHLNKVDHDIEYKITTKYPTIKPVDDKITISVGEKRKLEYTVTPSGLLPPPMNWGPIDYYGYSLGYIDMEDDGYDCYVTGKEAGKAVVAALPYGIQTMGFVYIITVVDSQKPKLTLSASPSGGQVTAGTTVTLTAKANGNTVTGCDIYFTTDGSNPSRNNGTKYSSGVTINSACTLKAIAYKSGYEDSDVLTAAYTIKEESKPKLTLSASPSGGQVTSGTIVTLTAKADGSTVTGCDIYFTTDGSNPSRNNGTKYSSGVTINSACTLKAIAYKSGYEDSDVLTASYTIKQETKPKLTLSASPSGGQVTSGTTVTLAAKANGSTVSDCDIYYTTDGTTPSKSNGKEYSSGITINNDCTLKAIAYKSGYEDSNVLTASYTIENTKKVNPTSIRVSRSSLSMKVTDTYEIIYYYDYPEGTPYSLRAEPSVTWSSNNNNVITLSNISPSCEKLTANSIGIATITVKSDNGLSAKCEVDVISQPELPKWEIKQVSAGGYHTMILMTDGTLWACGYNKYGQLGDGTSEDRSILTQIMTNVAYVSAGGYHTMILKTDGTLWACGKNEDGQLGDGTTTNRYTPIQVMADVAFVSASSLTQLGEGYTMILRNDGVLFGCGHNFYGELGVKGRVSRSTPVEIMDNVASVSAGGNHTMIIKNDGSLWSCGYNFFGQLGNGTESGVLEGNYTPQRIMTDVASVSAGGNHTMIIKNDGSLWACGLNGDGQLGDGTKHNSISTLKHIMNGVAAVSAGDAHTLVLRNDGTLCCFGDNYYGQASIDMTRVATMSAGGSHSIIVKTNGSLWAAGYNNDGQLGDCTNVDRHTAVMITDVLNVEQLNLATSSAGFSTFFDSESAYVLPSGLLAQVVTGASNSKLTYKTIADGSVSGVVPKSVPVMLVSDSRQAGTFTLTSSESTATYTGTNLLRGSDEPTTTTGEGLHYKLSYGPTGTKWDDVFGWYWGTQNGAPFQIEGHKAWLVVPQGNGTRAAGFSVDGEMLDIESLDSGTGSPIDNCYDLQGRRVSQPAKKGIYIINGKKVVK